MANVQTIAKPKRTVVRKPSGPKPIYVVYKAARDADGNYNGEIEISKLTTNAEDAMLALVSDKDNRFHRDELPVARRSAAAPEAAS